MIMCQNCGQHKVIQIVYGFSSYCQHCGACAYDSPENYVTGVAALVRLSAVLSLGKLSPYQGDISPDDLIMIIGCYYYRHLCGLSRLKIALSVAFYRLRSKNPIVRRLTA